MVESREGPPLFTMTVHRNGFPCWERENRLHTFTFRARDQCQGRKAVEVWMAN